MVCVCLKSQKQLNNVSCPLSFIKNICCSFVKANCSFSLTEALLHDLKRAALARTMFPTALALKIKSKYSTSLVGCSYNIHVVASTVLQYFFPKTEIQSSWQYEILEQEEAFSSSLRETQLCLHGQSTCYGVASSAKFLSQVLQSESRVKPIGS